MRLIDLRHLSGPNIYTTRPVTIARLELDELTGQETTGYPGFAGRLTALLTGLAEHHCAAGRPGGFTDAMARGTYFGHVTEHVALELSRLAGRDVHLGRTMWAGADGRYDVMMECPRDEPADSPVAAELLRVAIHAVSEVLAEREPELDADLAGISRRWRPKASASAPRLSPPRPAAAASRSAASAGCPCCAWATAVTGGWSAPR